MYAIGFNNLGTYGTHWVMGNDGTKKLINKTHRGWLRETEAMRDAVDIVYIVPNITQEMCEMSPARLLEYVENTCITRLK